MRFSHGMNDATKCIRIITLALVAAMTKGHFAGVPDWAAWLVTNPGTDPLALFLSDRLMLTLPRHRLHSMLKPSASALGVCELAVRSARDQRPSAHPTRFDVRCLMFDV
jgi:hypothetical protein